MQRTGSSPPNPATAAQEEQRLLIDEVLCALYGSTGRNALVALVVATTVGALQWRFVAWEALAAWLLLGTIAYGGRGALATAFLATRPDQRPQLPWLWAYRGSTLLCGAAWGLAGWHFYPQADVVTQAFLVIILVGVGCGAIMAYLIDPPSARLFCGGLYLPALAGFVRHGSSFSLSLALMLAVFLVYISVSSHAVARYLRENISLRIQAIRRAEAVHQLAFYDPLTQLPNRRLLLDRLAQALAWSARRQEHGAVVFLDLDRFKTLNDMKGHAVGDQLLKQVAQRLRKRLRAHETVARFGGDEFVLVLQGLGRQHADALQASRQVTLKIMAALGRPFNIAGYAYQTSCSLGVCLFLGQELPVAEILKRADMAMYQAKQAGRNTVCYHDQTLQPRLEARANLEAGLRQAVRHAELVAHYQLQVDGSGQPLGAELLLRWRHPQLGWVAPGEFIPIAEESNLICEIGDWVLQTACRQLQAWQGQAKACGLRLSINVSARQVEQADFVQRVTHWLRDCGCAPALLRLELTEGLMLRQSEELIDKPRQLSQLGLSLSLDDFGTGFSSLSMLKHFPLDELKIDRSFVADLPGNADDAVLVETIIAMGRHLGLEVIAEGVETEAQMDFLRAAGCVAYQGYLIGRPLPIADFEQQLAALPEPL